MIYTDANAMYFSSFHIHTLQLLSVGEKKGQVSFRQSRTKAQTVKHTQTGSCVNFFYLFFLREYTEELHVKRIK